MRNSEQKIECPTHGEAYATYVCTHLADNPEQQWFCDYPSEEKPWPDSWCHSCDQAFQEQGERNEKNEQGLDVKLICHFCYEQFKGSSFAPLMEAQSKTWQPYLSDAILELRTKQGHLKDSFDLSRHERWDWNQ